MPAAQKTSAKPNSSANIKGVEASIAEISNWIIAHARMTVDTSARNELVINHLREAGLPIARVMVAVWSLHPQVDAFSAIWEEGKETVFREHLFENLDTHKDSKNPIALATQHGKSSRHHITQVPEKGEEGIIADLREAGMTDYVVLALPFSDGSHRAITFATRNAQGFSAAHVEILHGITTALAATMEIHYLHMLTGVLMDTYVGPIAGRKVLQGAIKRGSGETIRAVIWFCDLKGFTALSEGLSGHALLATLNCYFEAMTVAIEAENGEVLKFIGDAILAIFQLDGTGEQDEKSAAVRALTAAQSAVRGLDVVNAERRANDQPHIECGIALHLGELLYGNVGGQRRLDFTVIGTEVNLTSRIESLTRELKRSVLVSAAFAEVHGGAFENLGEFSFKGIAQKGTVFAPRACRSK